MAHQKLLPRQYLILGLVALCAPLGDTCLSRGMTHLPAITLAHPATLIAAVFTPWIAFGIALLIGFFASYLTALSWADLTFVLPATAFGNVIVALLSRFWLHEAISLERWAGIVLITVGVGFVANGPSLTERPAMRWPQFRSIARIHEPGRRSSCDDHLLLPLRVGFWPAACMIAAIILLSTAGEVLTAAAMKSIGDLDDIRAHSGMKGAIRAVVTCPLFFAGVSFLALAFFSLLFALNHLNLSFVAPASASLTLVTNAIAGKIFLKENVDRRRWTSAVLVCIGVYLLAH